MMINDFLNFCQFNDNQKNEEKDSKLVLSDMLKPSTSGKNEKNEEKEKMVINFKNYYSHIVFHM